jgi:hypothetical protein
VKVNTETVGKTLKYNRYNYGYCLLDDTMSSWFKNADAKSDLWGEYKLGRKTR